MLVGDPDQLPPVGPGAFLEDAVASSFEIENVSYDDVNDDGGNDDERSGKTFSSSPLLLLPRVHLSRRFRQSSRSAIVEAALAAHSGRAPLPLHALSAEELLYRRGGGGGGLNNSSQPPLPLPSEALLVVPGTLRNAGLPLSSSSSSPQQLIPGHYEHELRAVLTNLLPSAGFDPVSDVQVREEVFFPAPFERRKKKRKMKIKNSTFFLFPSPTSKKQQPTSGPLPRASRSPGHATHRRVRAGPAESDRRRECFSRRPCSSRKRRKQQGRLRFSTAGPASLPAPRRQGDAEHQQLRQRRLQRGSRVREFFLLFFEERRRESLRKKKARRKSRR